MNEADTRRALALGALFPLFIIAVLMGSAGTLSYWQGWLFVAIFTLVNVLLTMYVLKHDPALFARRLHAGPGAEKRPAQKIIMASISFSMLGVIILAGLDRRFGWSHVPDAVVILGDALIVLSYWIIHVVFRANTYAASTIAVEEGQKVITTGPYAVVRHPMYSGAMIMLAALPLALASWWTYVLLIPTVPFFIWRIFDEEALLKENLDGYREYCNNLKWRLIPGVF